MPIWSTGNVNAFLACPDVHSESSMFPSYRSLARCARPQSAVSQTQYEYGIGDIVFEKRDCAHDKNEAKPLTRVRRIKGQMESIEWALDGETECEQLLRLVASFRRALNGLMAELTFIQNSRRLFPVRERTATKQKQMCEQA
jgi:DNA-binding FrmR family transcriptional regulator